MVSLSFFLAYQQSGREKIVTVCVIKAAGGADTLCQQEKKTINEIYR